MKFDTKEFFKFVGPSLITMTFLMIIPLFMVLYLSFQRFTYGSVPKFVGLKNYVTVLQSGRFWSSLKFTVIETFATTGVKLVLGFILAFCLYHVSSKLLRGIFISGIFIPFIMPRVVSGLIFQWLFKNFWGLYDWLLSKVGINISWFGTPWAAKSLIMIHWIWIGTAFSMLVFFAALQAMPEEPLEVATIDGANWWQKILYVVLPQLKSNFLFLAMISIMDAYRLYDTVAVMTSGGPGTATETVSYYNYKIALGQLMLGKGSAISILVIIGIFALLTPFLYATYKEQLSGSMY